MKYSQEAITNSTTAAQIVIDRWYNSAGAGEISMTHVDLILTMLQGWCLWNQNRPLFSERIDAFSYGPAISHTGPLQYISFTDHQWVIAYLEDILRGPYTVDEDGDTVYGDRYTEEQIRHSVLESHLVPFLDDEEAKKLGMGRPYKDWIGRSIPLDELGAHFELVFPPMTEEQLKLFRSV